MSKKEQLRQQREGTILNVTAKQQEKDIIQAISNVVVYLSEQFETRIRIEHRKYWLLKDIVSELRSTFHGVEFHYHFENSSIRPDGGILLIKSNDEKDPLSYPILIAEVKNQGTNDIRVKEGKPLQAKGNAIERLGKNLIGLRTALMRENIFPFVCFGYGCDFEKTSSILDRVTTMAMFGNLNKIYLLNDGGGRFNRGSFFFRPEPWTVDEMTTIMKDIAERSIYYYFTKYGKDRFLIPPNISYSS